MEQGAVRLVGGTGGGVEGRAAPTPGRRLRVLCVTKLFPNAAEPLIAPFNRQQFSQLGRLCDLQVLATLPWFPGASLFSRWSAAGRRGEVPRQEEIAGLPVRHPRVLYVPKVGHLLSPALYAASLAPEVLALRGRIDVVLASWAYPDGVAGVWLAKLLGVPAVVKVHGSDIDVLAEPWWGRALLSRTLPAAARVIAVSRPLAEKVVALGVPRDRVAFVPNGVDRSVFRLEDRAVARARVGLADGPGEARRWIVYVGRLLEDKGVPDLCEAFARIAAAQPELGLALVGAGPARGRCEALAAQFPGRVVLAGSRPLGEVAAFMAAADVVTLPSWHEGTPNVLLEALACGRRIVATRVGGIPDVVSSPALGELVEPRDVAALAEALARVARAPYEAERIAAAAPEDWSESARRVHDVLAAVVPAPAGIPVVTGA